MSSAFFGAFRSTPLLRVGQHHFYQRPTRLSQQQKSRVRKRLRQVDQVIDTLAQSRVALPELNEAMKMKRESELTPREKYFVFCRNPRTHQKPISWVPHFTKVPHPRGFPPGY